MRRLLLACLLLTLSACTPNLRTELDKMTKLSPSPQQVAPIRDQVRTQFTCPPASTHAYFLGEIDLASNATRVGVRCN